MLLVPALAFVWLPNVFSTMTSWDSSRGSGYAKEIPAGMIAAFGWLLLFAPLAYFGYMYFYLPTQGY